MAIQRNRGALEKLGAKIHDIKPPFKVSLHSSPPPITPPMQAPYGTTITEDAIAAAGAASAKAVAYEMSVISHQFAKALSSLKPSPGWAGNWNVHITKRDALGRISEVQFRPAKP